MKNKASSIVFFYLKFFWYKPTNVGWIALEIYNSFYTQRLTMDLILATYFISEWEKLLRKKIK